jgi:hypothetical protein
MKVETIDTLATGGYRYAMVRLDDESEFVTVTLPTNETIIVHADGSVTVDPDGARVQMI